MPSALLLFSFDDFGLQSLGQGLLLLGQATLLRSLLHGFFAVHVHLLTLPPTPCGLPSGASPAPGSGTEALASFGSLAAWLDLAGDWRL